MDGRTQRKAIVALAGGLTGLSFALVSWAHHEGRQLVARWLALMVICLWAAAHLYREGRRPSQIRQRWGEGGSIPPSPPTVTPPEQRAGDRRLR